MAKQNYGGVYANMDFPTYEYRAYPRHIVTGPNGLYEVANSAEEEMKIKARLRKTYDEMPSEPMLLTADPEKEILISRARELNVPINRKWSKQKLENVLKEAEAAIDDLPPEDELTQLDDLPATEDFAEEVTAEDLDEEDKDALLAKAKSLGIKVQGMHLWGVPRIKATIAEFKASTE